jgi:predicted HicB family RNase H-like nuclease
MGYIFNDLTKIAIKLLSNKFSGSLNIRISTETHTKVALLAAQKGISINSLIKNALEAA